MRFSIELRTARHSCVSACDSCTKANRCDDDAMYLRSSRHEAGLGTCYDYDVVRFMARLTSVTAASKSLIRLDFIRYWEITERWAFMGLFSKDDPKKTATTTTATATYMPRIQENGVWTSLSFFNDSITIHLQICRIITLRQNPSVPQDPQRSWAVAVARTDPQLTAYQACACFLNEGKRIWAWGLRRVYLDQLVGKLARTKCVQNSVGTSSRSPLHWMWSSERKVPCGCSDSKIKKKFQT